MSLNCHVYRVYKMHFFGICFVWYTFVTMHPSEYSFGKRDLFLSTWDTAIILDTGDAPDRLLTVSTLFNSDYLFLLYSHAVYINVLTDDHHAVTTHSAQNTKSYINVSLGEYANRNEFVYIKAYNTFIIWVWVFCRKLKHSRFTYFH